MPDEFDEELVGSEESDDMEDETLDPPFMPDEEESF